MAKGAKSVNLDFTKVKDGGNFSKRHQTPGDYEGKITKVDDAKAKGDGTPMWLFTIEVNGASYPLYCKHQENQLWKIRNLCIAAGINVPKKKVQVDPNRLVGRKIGVTLEDEEYEGKMQSVVQATFPRSELDQSAVADPDDPDDDDNENSDGDDEDSPAPETKAKAKKAKKVKDEDDEEPPAKAKGKKSKKAKKGSKDLDELDIEDI